MRLVTIIGNRPQFVKAAAVSSRLRERHEEILVHSGQHYDDGLSAVFFRELELPSPDRELDVGSGSHVEQIAGIMAALEPVLSEVEPTLALVYGDTNTTLAGALTCAKVGLPSAHVEAGMRARDQSMPEERNRLLADHLAELRLCATPTAVENLAQEGIEHGVQLVGDVMADLALTMMPVAERDSDVLERFGLRQRGYLLVTVHRAGNVDTDDQLALLVDVLETLPVPAVFPVHPRTRARLEATGALARLQTRQELTVVPPLGYLDFLRLLRHSSAVLTDSGGVQKEAYLASVPCLTLRDTTEWVETVQLGWNRLVGLDRARIMEALHGFEPPAEHPDLYGGGHAGDRVVDAIDAWASG